MEIRDAGPTDVEGVTAIYNDAVENTTAIWNDTKIDTGNRLSWLADRQRVGYPVLVAVDDAGTVLGYASFGDWRAWENGAHGTAIAIRLSIPSMSGPTSAGTASERRLCWD
jgi:phosphinothricin acetyltransferase